jgi:acyl-coenzyme A synthetase/AMP-(fatty) acid ligase
MWLAPSLAPDIEVVDEDDQPVRIGEEGILRVKFSPVFPTEYMDDPEATAQHFRNGYFYPGDMAVRRSDGRIRILGRAGDVLNLRGTKRAIGPFEDWARNILQVADVCIFAHQTDDGKEMLIVAIESSRLPDPAQLDAAARRLRQISAVCFQVFKKFPRSENGMMKVDRRELLRQARKAMAQGELPVAT